MTASFYLLRPEQLPREHGVLKSDEVACLEPLATQYRRATESQTLAAAREALKQLGLRPEHMQPVGEDPEESQGNQDNDRAFLIVRVQGRVMPLLVHSTLQGFATLLDEALVNGTDLEPRAWGRLRTAYNTLFDTFLGRPLTRDEELSMSPPRSTAESERDALRRWTRGHYVFMSIIQGLVVVLNGLRRDLETSDIPSAQVNFERATTIMLGAESALRFTGDYSYNAYEKSVRPTLMPPIAPPGMTGLRWRDHEYLVKVLSGMRHLFSSLDPALEPYREAFYASVAHAYDSHKLVCSSFVGTERTSILMAERTEKSAVEILDHFKRVRLQLVKN